MKPKAPTPTALAELRRRAEANLRPQRRKQKAEIKSPKAAGDAQRSLHELEIHQIELQMQNTELQQARHRLEGLVEKYTDLYDFAPVGYFSLDEEGRIQEVNLTGAAMLGVERSRLAHRRISRFVAPASQPRFLAFLQRVFAGTGQQNSDVALVKEGGATDFWARFRGTVAISAHEARKWCRVSVADITAFKQAEAAQRRVAVLAASNRKLEREIVRRQAGEKALKESEQQQRRLLEEARQMQDQLRLLSHKILQAQEEERKRISRELHDEIAQTLTGINLRLAALKAGAAVNAIGFQNQITITQQFVEQSVEIVHRFARELRPSVLDDFGLIPALRAFVKTFSKQTRLPVHVRVFAGVEQVDGTKRTVLYRVAQEALTNVARHARATRVELRIEKLADAVRLKIKDNGRAFSVRRTLLAKKNNRLGLLGMRERVEMVGGSFGVESAPGHGTTILAQIPWHARGATRKI